MDFDSMPWVVTIEDATYGPTDKATAVKLRDRVRGMGLQAQAWTAQAPASTVLPLKMAP